MLPGAVVGILLASLFAASAFAADPARLDTARYGDFGAFMVQTGLIKTAPPVDAIAVDLSAK